MWVGTALVRSPQDTVARTNAYLPEDVPERLTRTVLSANNFRWCNKDTRWETNKTVSLDDLEYLQTLAKLEIACSRKRKKLDSASEQDSLF